MRVHSECFTGDVVRVRCGVIAANKWIRHGEGCAAQRGVILYLRQEGRGIGLPTSSCLQSAGLGPRHR